MTDHVSPQVRSAIMRSVHTKGSAPEMAVRKVLHRLGYRYRLHDSRLPGSPDLVFPKRRKAIFVHGCFWHGHDCKWGRPPKSNIRYWVDKIEKNKKRDSLVCRQLFQTGWAYEIVWQCQLKKMEEVIERIVEFLEE